jgi:hypothetical protein
MNLELQVTGRPHCAGPEIFNVEVQSALEARHPQNILDDVRNPHFFSRNKCT